MEPNLAGSIYVRSSIKLLHLISKGDNHYLKKQQPFWMEGGAVGHNFERDTPRDHLCQVWTLHRYFLPSLAPFCQAVSEFGLGFCSPTIYWNFNISLAKSIENNTQQCFAPK
jgi:hypothetical protein